MVSVSCPLVSLAPSQLSEASQATAFDDDQVSVTCSSTMRLVRLAVIETVGADGVVGSGAGVEPPPPPPHAPVKAVAQTMISVRLMMICPPAPFRERYF